MGRKSSIEKLDPKLKKAIDDALRSGTSIDDLVEKIESWGGDISRSAVGRYSKSFNETMERINIARDVSERIVEDIGDASESKIARATIELIQTSIVQMITEAEGVIPMKFIAPLSKAVSELAKARKIDQDTILEIHEIVLKKAAAAAAKAGKKAGLSAASIEDVRVGILGIKAE